MWHSIHEITCSFQHILPSSLTELYPQVYDLDMNQSCNHIISDHAWRPNPQNSKLKFLWIDISNMSSVRLNSGRYIIYVETSILFHEYTMLHHLNLYLLQTDRHDLLLTNFITPINLDSHYNSNYGIFVSNLRAISRLLAPPIQIGRFWAKKKKRNGPRRALCKYDDKADVEYTRLQRRDARATRNSTQGGPTLSVPCNTEFAKHA